MNICIRSVLMAGVAMLTASAVAIAPSVQPAPPPAPAPTVRLAAAVQPLELQPLQLQPQPPLLSILLDSPLRLLGPAATPGTLPPPPAPIQFAIAPNLANTIDSVYIAVEPWVQYGFEVATAVVRWIPYVGWFAGQIMVFYEFGESIVASGVFNFTDWLRGDGGVVENLVDFGIDVGLAFVWLGLDELAQFVPLPPFCCYPPRPPLQGPFLAAVETLVGPTETAELTMALSIEESTEETVLNDVPVDETLKETQDEVRPDVLSEVVEAEEIVVEEDTEQAEEPDAQTVETATTDDETVVTDDTEAADDQGTKSESTTTSSDTVEAQGEVRGSDDEDVVKQTDESKTTSPDDDKAEAEASTTPASTNDAEPADDNAGNESDE